MLRRVTVLLGFALLVPSVSCFVERIPGRYCKVRTDCTDPAFPRCDTNTNSCIPMDFDVDMGTGGGDMTMIGCSTSSTCPASAPVCSPAQVCSSCGATGMSTDCNTFHSMTPLCGPNGGCVECLTKDNCDAVHQTCSPMNTCVPCVGNGDCTSGVCNAGVCANKDNILYVNNAPSAGCSNGGPGSFAMPFCTVQTGMNAAAMQTKQLVVFGGTYAENLQAAPSLNGGNDYVANVIGVGMPVVKPTASGAALNVGGTSTKQVTVSFDGFVFDGSTLADGSDGIDCTGGATPVYGKTLVTVTHSTVKGASGIGISALQKCTVTLDADVFTGNKGGALKSDTCDVAYTNLLVHDNGTPGAGGSSFGGLLFSAAGESGKTTMFNLTVVNNNASTTATASGIVCLAPPTTLANTLVLGNQGPAAMEISAGCMATYSAFIGGTSSNESIPVTGCGVADLLVNPAMDDYHPKKGGARPCTLVDQGTNTNAPDHDLEGTSRPQPASGTDDIGCYEAK